MTPLRKATEEFQREYLIKALELFEWNKSMTARKTGIGRKTVDRLIVKLGIEESAPGATPEPTPKRAYKKRRQPAKS